MCSSHRSTRVRWILYDFVLGVFVMGRYFRCGTTIDETSNKLRNFLIVVMNLGC